MNTKLEVIDKAKDELQRVAQDLAVAQLIPEDIYAETSRASVFNGTVYLEIPWDMEQYRSLRAELLNMGWKGTRIWEGTNDKRCIQLKHEQYSSSIHLELDPRAPGSHCRIERETKTVTREVEEIRVICS